MNIFSFVLNIFSAVSDPENEDGRRDPDRLGLSQIPEPARGDPARGDPARDAAGFSAVERGGGGSRPKRTVAYAVSFIKCGDKQTHSGGLVDASLVLRHSIHQTSSRNPASGSEYDYKMYAIVHRDAENCSAKLKDVGFEVLVVDPPVLKSDIRGEFLQKHIHQEWCCGPDEFIKLFAYTLKEEVIVHVDIDYAFYKPMDHLYDAIIYDKDSDEGKKARDALELERPEERLTLPDKIGAFITRDWAQVAPGKFPPPYQAGFLVARRDPMIMEEVVEIIKEGNFTEGWGRGSGWSGSGHGGEFLID